MRYIRAVATWAVLCAPGLFCQEPGAATLPSPAMPRPAAGPVEIMRSSEIRAGMKAVAWTVFQGSEPEAIPVDIVGLWKNAWGPKQDVILARLGGKAARTNVAGGMSGSPVYVDGKLIGAIALRISVFSPDAICGITPIEHMLEINEIDGSRPSTPRTPQPVPTRAELAVPAHILDQSPRLVPIETPLTFAGFHDSALREFQPFFQQMGIQAAQGGAAGTAADPRPAPGWERSLQPGDAIAGVLVSGDMNITGLGTVTYNDGRRVLGFGHSFFNLGPVSMPMSKGEVLMVLSSQFQPNKFANATQIVGALRQDRHSGIMGVLGETAATIPVSLRVKTGETEKRFAFNVFVHPKWTPFLMMLTLFNTLQDLNESVGDEATYALSGTVELNGLESLKVRNMVATGDAPMPAPMQLAAWWADRFNRLFQNSAASPSVKGVEVVVEMVPERRTAMIESAWLENTEVESGGEVAGKIYLKPWRGDRVIREFRFKVPAGLTKGDHRLLISDGDTLDRPQNMALAANRLLDLSQAISIMNQERDNNRLYVSLVESRPTVYADDKEMAGLPPSVLNVLQTGRSGRPYLATMETTRPQVILPSDEIVSGNAVVRFRVK